MTFQEPFNTWVRLEIGQMQLGSLNPVFAGPKQIARGGAFDERVGIGCDLYGEADGESFFDFLQKLLWDQVFVFGENQNGVVLDFAKLRKKVLRTNVKTPAPKKSEGDES